MKTINFPIGSVVFSILILICSNISFGQDIYATRHGVLYVTNKDLKNALTLHSNEIHILLDMKTAEFDFSIPIHSLHSDIDSLKNRIKNEDEKTIHVQGFLNLEKIDTNPHDPYYFTFKAELNYANYSKNIAGNGELEHIPGNEQPVCRLGLNFEIDDFELFSTYRDDLRFRVVQSILSQSGIN
jgi:hypothetical protein